VADLDRARRLVRGYRYADFTPGRRFAHPTRRTVDRSDSLLFSATTLSLCPLYFDADAARADGHPDIVVNPYFVLALAVGLSVEDLSEHSEAFLGISQAQFRQDVYPGDTIRAESVVEGRRESASRPGFGIVTWQTSGLNQRDEVVVALSRANLFEVAE
jgi:itaconyl-CoA hydratase